MVEKSYKYNTPYCYEEPIFEEYPNRKRRKRPSEADTRSNNRRNRTKRLKPSKR